MSGENEENIEIEIRSCTRAIDNVLMLEKLAVSSIIYIPKSFNDFTSLHPEEIAYAKERKSSERQQEFLRGRFALRKVLQDEEFDFTDPILIAPLGFPTLPNDVIGTVSHKCGEVIALIADSSKILGVGVDLEHLIAPARLNRIAKWLGLYDDLTKKPDVHNEQDARFILGEFSARESAIKAASIAFKYLPGIHSVSIAWQQSETDGIERFNFTVPLSNIKENSDQYTVVQKMLDKPSHIQGVGWCTYSENWLVTTAFIVSSKMY
jgi:4'-phosphopantetheinyl transferase EntD